MSIPSRDFPQGLKRQSLKRVATGLLSLLDVARVVYTCQLLCHIRICTLPSNSHPAIEVTPCRLFTTVNPMEACCYHSLNHQLFHNVGLTTTMQPMQDLAAAIQATTTSSAIRPVHILATTLCRRHRDGAASVHCGGGARRGGECGGRCSRCCCGASGHLGLTAASITCCRRYGHLH